MAIKETKRKAFNFLRSYFDVFNELKTDKDKLDFLTAILNKQFLDEDPKNLTFIVNLCYESQRHQIETSVKGWKRATKDTLGTTPPTPLGTTPLTNPKEEEEEVKEEEEEQDNSLSFDSFWNIYDKKIDKTKCEVKFNKLSFDEKEKIKLILPKYIKSTPEVKYRKNPLTWLNGKCWNDEVVEVKSSVNEIDCTKFNPYNIGV